MKKSIFSLFLLAGFILVGCQGKTDIDKPDVPTPSPEDDTYEVVVTCNSPTKGSVATMNLGLKDATSEDSFTATLYKNGQQYTDPYTVSWSWENSGGNYFNNTPDEEKCSVFSKTTGSGKGMIATASIGGKVVAKSSVAPVIVNDDRSYVKIHPRPVNLYIRAKRNYYNTGNLSIQPILSICDTEVECDEKEIDMSSPYQTQYLSWSFSTSVGARFQQCLDDWEDLRNYTDYSWAVCLTDIFIYSEEGVLTGDYKYSIKYGDYDSTLQGATSSSSLGRDYIRWGDYYVKPEWKSYEGKNKKYYKPELENNDAMGDIVDLQMNVAWASIPDKCFNIYVDLDLTEAGAWHGGD